MMPTQIALEEEMREAGRLRYFKLHEKAEKRGDLADTHAGRNVFDYVFDTFLTALENWAEEKRAGKAGRRPRAVKMIDEFGDTPTMAYIFVQHLINTTLILQERDVARRARMTRVALTTAQAIHDELRMRYFADNRKALLKQIVKDFNKRDLPRRRRRELMIKQFNTQQLEWTAEGWGQAERLNLGMVLIDIFRQSTGLIEEYVFFEGPKSINCITFSVEIREAILDRMDKSASSFSVFYPMVVPPKQWSNEALIGGGYYTSNVSPYRFVKGAKVKYLTELENTDMTKVLTPINAMQETGWRVNPQMAEVLREVFERNIEVKGLPTADPEKIPEPPEGVDDDPEKTAEYRKDCYIVHDKNRRMISKRIAVLRTLSIANRFAEYPAIYFPYDVDSRGRAYPKVPFLNPQGPDYVKALLEFSEGKPVFAEDYSAFYLTIAIANAWGQDKLPLEERAAWVEENQDLLLEVAADPLGDRRWLKAGEPFMALRGAMEWAGYCEYGEGYISHMPIHFDATCSGLQHFSALLRDEVGGFHVNLTADPKRQDIYAAVAAKAEETLRLASKTCDIARIALEIGITRALCKRPVMIVPYAGTFSACMKYVDDYYRELAEDGHPLPLEMSGIKSKVTPLVSKHVWEAISNTVIAARGAMDWITATARLASKGNDAPIQWTTPDGFTIQQAKYEEKFLSVDTYLDGGRRIRSRIVNDTDVLDSRKMAQSLSPNYIHSMDACHMRGAILLATQVGNMSFAMIHDSFGVHAADMHVFVERCIKPAFVEMYSGQDNLSLFREQLTINVPADRRADIPELPSKGTLDIEGVRDSQFFFS